MIKILVVDDEPHICQEFQELLEEEGHEVEVAPNGREAIQKVKDKQFDLIFLDVLMPRMEGREVFEEIKKISKVPVAIMSGYLTQNKEQEVLALGAAACFRKPLDLNRVRSLIDTVKDQKQN